MILIGIPGPVVVEREAISFFIKNRVDFRIQSNP